MTGIIADARPFKQFGVVSSLDGFEVICETSGRPVAVRDNRRAATGFAYKLNQAAATSPKALARALGAHGD